MLLALFIYLLIFLVICKIVNKFIIGVCRSNVSLVGKTALITGGNSGIGYYTALGLAARGCKVIIASRNNTEKIRNEMIAHTRNPNIFTKTVDFASLASVRKLAEDIIATEDRLDILINNSGAFGSNEMTEDGLHMAMQVNHFAGFLLTHLLTDLLKKSAPSRIIFTSSVASFYNNLTVENLNNSCGLENRSLTTDMEIYANSKLCNIITANGFAEKLKSSGVTSNSVHPGIVNTLFIMGGHTNPVYRFLYFCFYSILFKAMIFSRTPYEGSQTLVKLAVSNKLQNATGKHFWECVHFDWFAPKIVRNQQFCRQIWEESERLLKIKIK